MARLSATFVLLSIALAARGMPAPDGYDTKSDSNYTMVQQPEKKVLWSGANCVNSCRSSWGWVGHVFGDDPWGKVMSSGDPVSTPSPSEAAFTFKPLTSSVPIRTSAFVTSSSTSSSTSTSFSTSSTFAPTTSASTEATVRIFNALPNTGHVSPFPPQRATYH